MRRDRDWLVERGILPGSGILDAGCGTGRYAIELARRGYVVHGLDLSPDLVDMATRAIGDTTGRWSFGVGDIAHLPVSRYAAILCRGVLNDIIDDVGRDATFRAFADALANGVLILDVREWSASLERKTREPLFRKRVSTDRGELTFTSITAPDPENRQLLIAEQHELIKEGTERVSDYHFVMRCWEKEEIDTLLAEHDFGAVRSFGAYDAGIAAGATDRLVAVAQRSASTASGGAAAVMRFKNLFFDLDGTLTHPHEGITRCIQHALKAAGVDPPAATELLRFVGPPLRDSFALLLATTDDARLDQALSAYRARFETIGIFENSLCPGIPVALERLAGAGLQLSVVTAKPTVFARRVLAHFGLGAFFDGVYGPDVRVAAIPRRR